MIDIISQIAELIIAITEAAAAVVILAGALQALWAYFGKSIILRLGDHEMTKGRIKFGHYLILGLDLLIAADILKTAMTRQWQDIWQLAAIIGMRTVLGLFLTWELDRTEIEEITERKST